MVSKFNDKEVNECIALFALKEDDLYRAMFTSGFIWIIMVQGKVRARYGYNTYDKTCALVNMRAYKQQLIDERNSKTI